MPSEHRITLEQLQAAGARIGATVGDEAAMLLPLINNILAGLDAVPDAPLRQVEPLLIHDAHRAGTA